MNIKGYLINLDERKDRLEHCLDEFKKVDFQIPWERLEAVTYKDSTIMPSGAKGCLESHIKCIKYAATNEAGYTLIMEDDIQFSDDFKEYFPKYIEVIQDKEWDIFTFYNSSNSGPKEFKLLDRPSLHTHFYFVKNSSAQKILNNIVEIMPIDNQLVLFAQHPAKFKIKILSAGQQLVIQNFSKFGTNITTESWVLDSCNGVVI
jgi:GR25 family glycosyltransferase involved in LPS biosynthesis